MKDTTIQKRENQQMVNIPERIEQAPYFTPLVDIVETDDAFLFQADMPGVKPGDVDDVLTIHGKAQPRQPADQRYIWQDYEVGHFYRQFTLNTPINADAIKAEYRDGTLNLTVPKADSARRKKIRIESA
jgi:HSP20 family protein